VTDNIKSMSDNPITIIGLLLVIILAFILSYIMYYFISSNLFNQSRVIISGTKMPVLCNILKKNNITKKNPSGNGKKRTYTFWIYINDLNYMTNSYKNVAYIGDENSLKNRSPYIFLDKNNNKLFVRFSKQDITSSGDDSLSNNFENAKSANDIDNMGDFYNFISQGITIDYVPIQRWVHIAIVINDIGRSATMSAYVDGDISKMITNGNEMSESQGHNYNITNLDLDKAYKGIAVSSGNSFVHETESQVILNGSYNINFTMDLVLKDTGLFDDLARKLNAPLEISPKVVEIFKDGQKKYGSRAWSSMIVKRMEDANNINFRASGFPSELTDNEPEEKGYEI